jgi:hypothetical protein
LWEAVSEGGITLEEARMLGDLLEKHKEVLKARDHERRLTILEGQGRRTGDAVSTAFEKRRAALEAKFNLNP